MLRTYTTCLATRGIFRRQLVQIFLRAKVGREIAKRVLGWEGQDSCNVVIRLISHCIVDLAIQQVAP